MSVFSKISLGSITKRYTHNMSFDNNTTLPFGVVQPFMTQYMMPDSSISVSARQLLRLAPMPVPTFGRVSLRSEAFFVPLSDVCPFYEALLSEQSYSVGGTSYYPSQVPVTTNSILVLWMMIHACTFSVYRHPVDTLAQDKWLPYRQVGSGVEPDFVLSVYKQICQNAGIPTSGNNINGWSVLSDLNYDDSYSITPASADFIVSYNDSTNQKNSYLVCFRLNNFGRRLRSNLIGLGYSLNIKDRDEISILPMLAYFKAWFDYYEVKRTRTWLNTQCYSFIRYIENGYKVNFTPTLPYRDSGFGYLHKFLTELGNTWYVSQVDYISSHRDSIMTQQRSADAIVNDDELEVISTKSSDHTLPDFYESTQNTLSTVSLSLLDRLTKFIAKDSVIGGKLSDWLRLHYGADVSNSLYKQSNHIGGFRLDANINDVYSTSDTVNTDSGTGDYLGSFAGKGLGYQQSGFKFSASVHGYIFCVGAIVPDSGYFQGSDPTLYAIDRSTIPIPDYDCLGYELTPKYSIISDNSYCTSSSSDDETGKSFGYVPRYTSFKQKKNVVNGDMSRNGTLSSYAPYYLDRILTMHQGVYEPLPKPNDTVEYADGIYFRYGELIQPIPTASEIWRYPCRYPWLGNFNRIFYNSGSLSSDYTRTFADSDIIDDNFICQSVFDVKVSNRLKPVSLSYDTFVEDVDNSSHIVKND